MGDGEPKKYLAYEKKKPAMSSQYFAIGADWCRYSQMQQEALEKEGLGDRMIMCRDREDAANANLTDEQKAVCEAAMPQVQGFPSWFEQSEDGSVKPVQTTETVPEHTVTRGVHFMDSMSAICEVMPLAGCENVGGDAADAAAGNDA